MSTYIEFKSGTQWWQKNWIFHQLADDIVRAFDSESDADLREEVRYLEAISAWILPLLDVGMDVRVLAALRRVIDDTLSGKIPGWRETKPADTEGHVLYDAALRELSGLIRSESGI